MSTYSGAMVETIEFGGSAEGTTIPDFQIRQPKRLPAHGAPFTVTLFDDCMEVWRHLSRKEAEQLRDWLIKELA